VVRIVEVAVERGRGAGSRRVRFAACAVSLLGHSATLYALSLPGFAVWRPPVLRGSPDVAGVELTALWTLDPAEQAPDDPPVRIEVSPPERPAERLAQVALPRLAPPRPMAEEPLEPLAVAPPEMARRAVQDRPHGDPPSPPPPERLRRTHASAVVHAAATPEAVGFDRTAPEPLDNPRPVYPPAAIARGWQGKVVLRLSVDAEGRVDRVEIAEGSGFAVLDEAAAAAARQWRFHPARQRGAPVGASVLLPVVFELGG
jgi:periplasmic protein TonB